MPTTIRNQTNNVQPNQNIQLEIISTNGIEATYFFQSDEQGNFDLEVAIPQYLENQALDFKYTNLNTSEVKTVVFNAPALSTVPLDLIFPDTIYTGNGKYGSYQVFPGVAVTGEILDFNSSQYAVLDKPGNDQNTDNYEIEFPFGTAAGNYEGTLSALGYPSPDIEPITVSYGLAAEVTTPDGLRFRGQDHNVLVQGEPGVTVTMNAFGNNYSIVLDGNGENNYIVTIPLTANFGQETATFSTPNVPFTVDLQLRVDNEADYILSSTFPINLITNQQQNQNPDLTGLALPGKTVNLIIPELSLNLNAIANEFGVWKKGVPNIPWQAAGTFTIEASAPGETTINGSGNHKPDIQFVSTISNTPQGAGTQTFQVRADANTQLNFNITNYVVDTTITTDSNGYVTLNFPAISLNTYAPDTVTVSLTYLNDPFYSNSFNVSIIERVPLTLAIANPPTIPNIETAYDILLINETYNIAGNAPTTGILTLGATGEIVSFVRDTYVNDTYTATLVTSTNPSDLTLTASTAFQPSLSQSYKITHPLALNIPTEDIYYDDPLITITATTTPNVLVSLKLVYLDQNNVVQQLQSFSTIANGSGIAVFNISPLDVTGAIKLLFQGFVSPYYQIKKTRNYFNSISQTVGIDTGDLIALADSSIGLATRIRNTIESYEMDIEHQYKIALESNVANALDWGFYFVSTSSTPTNPGYSCYGIEPEDALLSNGFTTFDTLRTDGNINLFRAYSNTYNLFIQKLTLNDRQARLTINGVQTIYPFTYNDPQDFHDFCWVYQKNDPNNSNNSSFQLYIDGQLIFNHQLNFVFTIPSSAKEEELREVKASSATYFEAANNFLLYKKALAVNDIANLYHDGIRKKARKVTLYDICRNHRNAFFPTDNDNFGLRYQQRNYLDGTTANGNTIITDINTNNYYATSNAVIETDDSGRKYFNCNGLDRRVIYQGGTYYLHKENYIVLRRKNLNSTTQVFLEILENEYRIELAFTSANTILVTYYHYTSSTERYKQDVYQSNLIATTDILCIYFRTDVNSGSTPNIIDFKIQGETIAPVSSQPVSHLDNNYLTVASKITIGGKFSNTNSYFAAVDFYCYLPFYPIYTLDSSAGDFLVPLKNISDRDIFPSYVFWIMGFKEAMKHHNPTFPLLSQKDGYCYI